MADPQDKWDDNAPGKFYVDKECILCSLCVDLAPDSFKESDEGDHDVVFKQPESEDETQAAVEAMEQCPVNAIGDDG
ncbi:MAG: ferredoxin [Planctomycetota bacterium]